MSLFGALCMVPAPRVKAASPAGTRFDGTWSVTLVCPDHRDAKGSAEHYTYHFLAHVKNGVLHGEHEYKDMPGWLEIDGQIQADGSAEFHANGVSRKPPATLNNAASGTPYSYQVKAHFEGHFEGARGTGSRVGGRTCNFTFIKGSLGL